MRFKDEAMSVLAKGSLQGARCISQVSSRCFCSSLEEVASSLDQARRHTKVQQKTTMPRTMTEVHGPGTDLHIPKNMAELSVFSGQPIEHRNRTVIIAPRQLKTTQSGMSSMFSLFP